MNSVPGTKLAGYRAILKFAVVSEKNPHIILATNEGGNLQNGPAYEIGTIAIKLNAKTSTT